MTKEKQVIATYTTCSNSHRKTFGITLMQHNNTHGGYVYGQDCLPWISHTEALPAVRDAAMCREGRDG